MHRRGVRLALRLQVAGRGFPIPRSSGSSRPAVSGNSSTGTRPSIQPLRRVSTHEMTPSLGSRHAGERSAVRFPFDPEEKTEMGGAMASRLSFEDPAEVLGLTPRVVAASDLLQPRRLPTSALPPELKTDPSGRHAAPPIPAPLSVQRSGRLASVARRRGAWGYRAPRLAHARSIVPGS
jgi:hypothetical protein